MPNDDTNKNGSSIAHLSRRRLLLTAGAGMGLGLGSLLAADRQECHPPKPLQPGDKVDVGGKADEIIRKAYELGYRYEKQHGGCARCTVAALQDAIPFVAVDVGLFRGATCLDGGATPVNLQNCGAFTGAGMVIGQVCGSTRGTTFEGSPKLAHQLLHKVYYRFKAKYNTILCKDVRAGAKGDCPAVCGQAAQWVAEVLLEEFADYKPQPQPADNAKASSHPSNTVSSAAH